MRVHSRFFGIWDLALGTGRSRMLEMLIYRNEIWETLKKSYLNDVTVMEEMNWRNKLTANFSKTNEFKITAPICTCSGKITSNWKCLFHRGNLGTCNKFMIGIGIGIKQWSGLRNGEKILAVIVGLKNPIGSLYNEWVCKNILREVWEG